MGHADKEELQGSKVFGCQHLHLHLTSPLPVIYLRKGESVNTRFQSDEVCAIEIMLVIAATRIHRKVGINAQRHRSSFQVS